jgi:hypothetical protein
MSADAENRLNNSNQSDLDYDPFNDPVLQRRAKSILSRLPENRSAVNAVITLLICGAQGKMHFAYGDGMRLKFANPEPQFSDRNLDK